MRDGAFSAPGLFHVFVDRIRATAYPSDRWIASAALSARSVEELDELIDAVGSRLFHVHLSPRRLELLGMITERRRMLPIAQRYVERYEPEEVSDLRDAVGLLEQTSQLLD